MFIHPKTELNKEGVKSHYSFMTQKWFQFFPKFCGRFHTVYFIINPPRKRR